MRSRKVYLALTIAGVGIVLNALLTGCSKNKSDSEAKAGPQLKASVTHKAFFGDIPSGSGLEVAPGGYYIIGDDSPFLYHINSDYTFKARYALFDTSSFVNGRIPKPLKPDLESLATIKYKNKSYLFTMSSGSSEVRNLGFTIELPLAPDKPVVRQFNLTNLLESLQQDTAIVGEELLNIEGVALSDTHLYLLQRALNKAGNVVISIKLQDFMAFLFEQKPVPAFKKHFFQLPELQKYQAGFSGGYVFDDKLFFTASIESAPNAILDGEVLGSYIGFIPLQDIVKNTDLAKPIVAHAAKVLDEQGETYTGKIESLVVKAGSGKGNYKVIAVSDDDQGNSEVLEINFIVD